MFASETDYIFYALSVTQKLKIKSQTNMALKRSVQADWQHWILKNSFSETIRTFLSKGDVYQLMGTIKEIPANQKKIIWDSCNG